MAEKDLSNGWGDRISESLAQIAIEAPSWRYLYKLWRAIPPRQTKQEDNRRANIFVPVVGPIIMTFLAQEMMFFFGNPSAITVKIVGSRHDGKLQLLEDRLQKVIEYFLSQPFRFRRLYTIIQDKYIYGTSVCKTMPAIDEYNIMETEAINGWDFLYDPQCRNWDEILQGGWCGHEKIVPKEQLMQPPWDKIYDQKKIKAYKEGGIKADIRPPYESKKGLLITEIWDNKDEKIKAFIDRAVQIRRDRFPHKFPYILGLDMPESNRMFAIGESEWLKWTQMEINTLRCQRLDNIYRAIHNMWLVPDTVDIEDMRAAGPNAFIQWRGGEVRPEPLFQPDVTRTLQLDIMEGVNEARRIAAGSGPLSGEMPTKRMATPEAMAMLGNARAQFWMKLKVSESNFWLPWAENLVDFIVKKGPDDLFDKIVTPMDDTHDTENFDKYGRLRPKDLRGFEIQIQAKMSYDVLNDERKRQLIWEGLQLAGTAWADMMDRRKALDILTNTYRDIPGFKDIFKTPPRSPDEGAGQLMRLLETMYGGGGKKAPTVGG